MTASNDSDKSRSEACTSRSQHTTLVFTLMLNIDVYSNISMDETCMYECVYIYIAVNRSRGKSTSADWRVSVPNCVDAADQGNGPMTVSKMRRSKLTPARLIPVTADT